MKTILCDPISCAAASHNHWRASQLLTKFWPLLLAATLLFWNLAYAPFWNPDEGRYSASALEMAGLLPASAPDWVVPHLNTIPRLNKPPLVYWLAGSFFRFFGPSEVAGRLVPALAALGILLLLWRVANRVFGLRAAQISVLVWATAFLPCVLARTLNTDMLLCLGITLAAWSLWALGESQSGISSKMAILGGALGFSIALLAKGPIGAAIPIGAIVFWRWKVFGFRRIFEKRLWWPVLVALGLAILAVWPWCSAVETRHPGFLRGFLLGENLSRFAGGAQGDHESAPFWYYAPVLLLGLLPWTGFLPIFADFRPRNAPDTIQNRARLFCLIWALLVVGFFSLSGTKLISYVLPAFPPLALLLGAALSENEGKNGILRAWILSATLFLNAVILVASAIFLLNGKILARAEAFPLVFQLAFVVLAGSMALIWAARRSLFGMAQTQSVFSFALYLVIFGVASRVAPVEDVSVLARQLALELRPDDRVVSFKTFAPATIFYLKRPLEVFEFHNSSGLNERALQKSPLFSRRGQQSDEDALAAFLAGKGRTFVWTHKSKKGGPIPRGAWIWGENKKDRLLCNRPAPASWKVEKPRWRAEGKSSAR